MSTGRLPLSASHIRKSRERVPHTSPALFTFTLPLSAFASHHNISYLITICLHWNWSTTTATACLRSAPTQSISWSRPTGQQFPLHPHRPRLRLEPRHKVACCCFSSLNLILPTFTLSPPSPLFDSITSPPY